MDKIVIRGDEYSGKTLKDGNCFIANSLPCDELTIDTLRANIDGSKEVGTLFVPKGSSGLLTSNDEIYYVRPYFDVLVNDPTIYKYGEEVRYYNDDTLVALLYMDGKPKRVGKYLYSISCFSAIGLLGNSTHYGGIYTGQTFAEVADNIIGEGIMWSYATELQEVRIYGWLPIATRRANLQQLLFAVGVSVKKGKLGNLELDVLSSETSTAILDDRIYLGGSVDGDKGITAVEVTEHAYHAYDTDELATLFDGESSAEQLTTPNGDSIVGVLVKFSDPMHDLSAENVAILESGVNYAVIGPASDGKLTGKKYTHTTRIIKHSGDDEPVGPIENVKTVKNATLVSLANSENVAKRVFSYYGKAEIIACDIVAGSERPGDYVELNDPFGDQRTAFIQSMDITMSNVLRAQTKIVSGYTPTGSGNFYTQSALLTSNGWWTVPPGVSKIRAVIGGGGDGGYSGGRGKTGDGSFAIRSMGRGGAAGIGGYASQGGKILIVTISVTPGQKIFFSPGSGASGFFGWYDDPTPGNSGFPSKLSVIDGAAWEYSSANGKPSATGFTDIFGKGTFGLPGMQGNTGAKGSGRDGLGPSVIVDDVTYVSGQSGKTVQNINGTGQGGAGGGAGYGSDGLPGKDGLAWMQSNGARSAQGGNGGDGGIGMNGTDATGYGNGGNAGHGGGGGGAGGGASASSGQNYAFGGDGGLGGLGGRGGAGGGGWAIIYY